GGGGSGKGRKGSSSAASTSAHFILDVLVNTAPPPGGGGGAAGSSGSLPRGTPVRLLPPGDKSGVPLVVTVSLAQVDRLSSVRIYLQRDLRPLDGRRAGVAALAEALGRLAAAAAAKGRGGEGVPLLDPEDDMKGSLVRAIRRLEELMRQLAEALHSVGEEALAERFEEARTRIKRDIIFAASLYL
ncbi:Superkiller viralicidic activity 2-like 2, partial [Tetrabaena socialis]